MPPVNNTLPAGADRVRATIAGVESISKELLRSTLPDPNGAGQLTFFLTPGQYTYTAQALQGSLLGSSVLSTIGPIPITVSPNFPLSIPMIAAFTYDVDLGTDTAFIDGGDGNDTLIVNHNGQPFLIRDTAGNVIYQFGSGGTTITVANVEHITVNDSNGTPVFTWP